MNTTRGSTRRSRLIKMSAAVGAALITTGLAAAGTVPAHDRAIGQAPAATATASEPLPDKGGRNSTPSELAVMEITRGPEIVVDGLFGPKTSAATQVLARWPNPATYGPAGQWPGYPA